jgi:dihydrofolate synthase/folylpolyglutamate synthase
MGGESGKVEVGVGEAGRKGSSRIVFATRADVDAYLRSRLNVEALRPASVEADKVFRLERMTALLERLGNPQRGFRAVHVAGSKGKGSVCEMTAACLDGCGYATGLYTSPHLVDIRERIRVRREWISDEAFAAVIGAAASAASDIARTHGEATHFEIMTAAAYLHFAQQAVDIAVVEVGMGGRLDATNVLSPEVSVITAIHPEHVRFLGPTIADIARHKAGIMKPGVPAISATQTPEVAEVLRQEARRVGADLAFLRDGIDFTHRLEFTPELGTHVRVVLTTAKSAFEHLPVPLCGEHQAENCGLALAVMDRLRARGLPISDSGVAEGLARTPSNGRLELVLRSPRLYVDGAHTPESIRAVIKALASHGRSDSLVCVFGCAADKDVPGMLKALGTGADKVFFTRAEGSTRSADPRELARRFIEFTGKPSQVVPSVREALNLASRAAASTDAIVVTGSFAVAGEAKRLILEKARADVGEPSLREIKPDRPERSCDTRGRGRT